MIAPASTQVLFNKNIANFAHNRRQNQYSKSFGFCDRTFNGEAQARTLAPSGGLMVEKHHLFKLGRLLMVILRLH